MDERSKLPGYHDEEPGSQAEAESMGSGLVNLPFDGQLEESSGLTVSRNVEVRVLKLSCTSTFVEEEQIRRTIDPC